MSGKQSCGWIVALAVSVSAGIAHADVIGGEDYVVGGVRTSSGESLGGSVVALYSETDKGGALCTATLIARDFALTAAHCVDQGIVNNAVVIFADDIQDADREVVRVVEAEVPREWKETHSSGTDFGDIAVVRLEGKLPRGYHPAHLAPERLKLERGGQVVLAGYGIANARRHTGAGQLRQTTVKVLEPELGKTEMIFDQTQGSGACHGDSGGPAFIEKNGKRYLVGVTNRGYPDGAPDDCRQQVVYARVGAWHKWIGEAVKAMRRSR